MRQGFELSQSRGIEVKRPWIIPDGGEVALTQVRPCQLTPDYAVRPFVLYDLFQHGTRLENLTFALRRHVVIIDPQRISHRHGMRLENLTFPLLRQLTIIGPKRIWDRIGPQKTWDRDEIPARLRAFGLGGNT